MDETHLSAPTPPVPARRHRCACGHASFPDTQDPGHFRGPGDTGAQRRGPCRTCACQRFRGMEGPDATGDGTGTCRGHEWLEPRTPSGPA